MSTTTFRYHTEIIRGVEIEKPLPEKWHALVQKFLLLWLERELPPDYQCLPELNVICACGHVFKTRSTHKGDIRVEICSQCHPFFTGKQKLIDTAGRVDKFERKYKATRGAKAPQPVA